MSRETGAVARAANAYVAGGASADKTITCIDCGGDFIWTRGEQAYYAERNFSQPRRCAKCRAARKNSTAPEGAAGPDPKDEAAPPRKHPEVPIICAQCGMKSTVPFYPTQGKPVYCRPCHLSRQ